MCTWAITTIVDEFIIVCMCMGTTAQCSLDQWGGHSAATHDCAATQHCAGPGACPTTPNAIIGVVRSVADGHVQPYVDARE
mmetsp:Transcript_16329/g.32860  ORF Transcript_16329/g.32860 Transcript_16329/m.32860 type:complete len:81 (+) Transcript_16329:2-244(+)